MDRSDINIACAADNNFAMPLAVTLYSVLDKLSKDLNVQLYIFDSGISSQNKCKIEKVLRNANSEIHIKWFVLDINLFTTLVNTQRLNATAYARLAIESSLPNDADKVLYLDSDLIIYDDIAKLWHLSIENHTLLAVRDYGVPYVASPLGLIDTYKLLKLAPDTPYFNSGVMLINLKRWREEKISSRVISYLQEYKHTTRFADQDGLNAILAGSWGEIDPSWNVQVGAVRNYHQWEDSTFKEKMQSNLSTLVQQPRILHFTGSRKPWLSGLTNPTRHHFHTNLKRSKWFSHLGYELWRLKWLGRCTKNIWQDMGLSGQTH